MVDAHRRSGADVTLGVVPNPAPDRYGGVVLDEDGTVCDFTRPGLATESWHFVGLQVANRSVFAGLEDGVAIDSVNRVYRDRLTSVPGTVRAFRGTGRFLDVGRPADYLDAAIAMARGGDGDLVDPGAEVAATACLRETIVWPGAVIGPGATLTRCIVSDDVEIPAGFAADGRVIVPASDLVPRAGDRVEAGLLICPL